MGYKFLIVPYLLFFYFKIHISSNFITYAYVLLSYFALFWPVALHNLKYIGIEVLREARGSVVG
jgi:hypothetical protein